MKSTDQSGLFLQALPCGASSSPLAHGGFTPARKAQVLLVPAVLRNVEKALLKEARGTPR